MADLPSYVKILIIGGGAVGCSTAFHLAERGETDVLLLEKNELTAGSTWHAAGNVPNFSTSLDVLRIQAHSVGLYAKLSEYVDYPMNYHQTGSIRLAQSDARLDEFHHVAAMAGGVGVEMRVMTPDDLKAKMPLLEVRDLAGGLWDPLDGDIDPAQLSQALAKGARDKGVTIRRFCPVVGISRHSSGAWAVETPDGAVMAEKIINAAGYYAPQIGAMLDRAIPSTVMEHQYLVTDDHPRLAATAGKIPLVRDPDDSYYLRQEGNGLILGPYEKQATPVWRDGLPGDFSFQLYQEDLDRLEWYIERACARVPILAEAGVKNVINGPIPYAPDGNPLIGPVPGVENAFEACVFTFGIAQGGGAGKVMADWVLDGAPEDDMWAVDPRRFKDFATPAYSEAKAIEIYSNEYAMHPPCHEWPMGRPVKMSPVYGRLKAKGARFGARGGWERAVWFPKQGDAADEPRTFDRPSWFHRVGDECRMVAERAGVLDMPGFAKFDVSGGGASGWLDTMTCSRLPKAGRAGLAYFLNHAGNVVTEMTIARMAENAFRLIGPAPGEWADRDWLLSHLPADGSVTLENVTDETGALIVTGPKARDVLAPLTDADLGDAAFPWMSHAGIDVAGVPVQALRLSYVGELGWELHAPMDAMAALYDAVMTAGEAYGAGDFGMYAMECMRLEKGYRAWKQELLRDVSALTAGLSRFIDFSKARFIGKTALEAVRNKGAARDFAVLVMEPGSRADRADAPLNAPVWRGEKLVGVVTSGGYGHRVEKAIAFTFLDASLCRKGAQVDVEIYGERCPAAVVGNVLYDPANERLKA